MRRLICISTSFLLFTGVFNAYLFVILAAEVYIQKLFCRNKRTEFCIQDSLLYLLDALCNLGVLVEVALECLIDALVHPVFVLAVTVRLIVTVCHNVIEELLYAVPYLLQTGLCN